MKFLAEIYEGSEIIAEGAGDDKKLYIHGIHAQANLQNRNKRIYSKPILEKAINDYNEKFVKTNRALGELSHPSRLTVDPDHVSHRICELNWDGDNVIGKSLILNTPKGNIIKGLLEGGTNIGVSTRGAGSVSLKEGVTHVGNDFVLATIDVVLDPSGIHCFVDPLMESADWILESGVWKMQEIEQAQESIKKASSKMLNEESLKVFANFMSKLKQIP